MSAVFLDVDGTLVPYAASPGAVRVDPQLIPQLSKLAEKLGGALALLSGRRLENLDELFAPLTLPAAGLHGLQRRGRGQELGPRDEDDATSPEARGESPA